MMKYLLLLSVILGFSSCSDDYGLVDGTTPHNYYVYTYVRPTEVKMLRRLRDKSFEMYISHADSVSLFRWKEKSFNIEKFDSLAREHNEDGRTQFMLVLGCEETLFYDLSNVKMYQRVNGSMMDFSDQAQIEYRDCSEYIASRYKSSIGRKLRTVKVSELTAHDIKWLSAESFKIKLSNDVQGEFYVTFVFKDGQTLTAKLED